MTRDDARSAAREELRWVIVPEGARRSRSTGTPGYERDLIRDASGNLLGPTESRPADLGHAADVRPAGPTLGQQAAGAAAEAVMTALTPYIERAVEIMVDSAIDGVARLATWTKRKVADRKSTRPSDQVVVPAVIDAELVDAELVEAELVENGADSEPGDHLMPARPVMDGEEYRARFIAALAAELFAADEKRKLAAVEVADDALSPELRAALRESLERPASLLDEDKLALVVEFLGASRADSPYVLLPEDEAERIQKELDTE